MTPYLITLGTLFLLLASGTLAYLWVHDRSFDRGWLHRHLGGRRRPWKHGENWAGNGYTPGQLDAFDLLDRPEGQHDIYTGDH